MEQEGIDVANSSMGAAATSEVVEAMCADRYPQRARGGPQIHPGRERRPGELLAGVPDVPTGPIILFDFLFE